MKRDPSKPNLRQVHLIHEELLAELAEKGFRVLAGQIGENITIRNNRYLRNSSVNGVCTGGNMTFHGQMDGVLTLGVVPVGAASALGASL